VKGLDRKQRFDANKGFEAVRVTTDKEEVPLAELQPDAKFAGSSAVVAIISSQAGRAFWGIFGGPTDRYSSGGETWSYQDALLILTITVLGNCPAVCLSFGTEELWAAAKKKTTLVKSNDCETTDERSHKQISAAHLTGRRLRYKHRTPLLLRFDVGGTPVSVRHAGNRVDLRCRLGFKCLRYFGWTHRSHWRRPIQSEHDGDASDN